MVGSGILEKEMNCDPNVEEVSKNVGANDESIQRSQCNVSTPVTVNVVADNNGNVQSTNSLNSKASMSGDVNKLLSYASMVKSDDIPVSLEFIPTLFTENGNEVVIFDEEIVKQGSERWGLTVCGHFVGFDMHISELRYNIRRMWGKFGIVEIDRWKNGWYMFKFRDEIGMNAVLEKGPWMVRNKPLFVQKWNSEIGMSKVEPKKLPVWVKLNSVPLEAWCVKGISALASSLGKPILMDTVTATMCHKGIGNFGFARVLVEMDAEKDLKDEIEIHYVDKNNAVKGSKKIRVDYDWKPPICSHCKVFGHHIRNCNKEGDMVKGNDSVDRPEEDVIKNGRNDISKPSTSTEFSVQGRKKQWNNNRNFGNHAKQKDQGHNQKYNMEFRRKKSETINNGKNNDISIAAAVNVGKNKWKVRENVVEEIRSTANKYSALDSVND
ncbi:RNA-directed DNA polymerase, eukaryota, reverse transcriptase zinc-binding domain protein [Tanacetum coccineum]